MGGPQAHVKLNIKAPTLRCLVGGLGRSFELLMLPLSHVGARIVCVHFAREGGNLKTHPIYLRRTELHPDVPQNTRFL